MSEIQIGPDYVVSMSGIHGAGKATLCAGLCAELGLRPNPVKVFALGRMLDEEGLWTCRANALEQNRQIRESAREPAAGEPARTATSRLGLLDVAIYGAAMAGFGRIDPAPVEKVRAALRQDMAEGYLFPQALIGMVGRADVIQERLLARDARKGLTASRGTKKLDRMYDLFVRIYRDGDYPDDLVGEIVETYRRERKLLLIDTSEKGIEEVRREGVEFLAGLGLV
jgi:hypothetical protein